MSSDVAASMVEASGLITKCTLPVQDLEDVRIHFASGVAAPDKDAPVVPTVLDPSGDGQALAKIETWAARDVHEIAGAVKGQGVIAPHRESRLRRPIGPFASGPVSHVPAVGLREIEDSPQHGKRRQVNTCRDAGI